jgi:hypothetical protein
LLPSRLLPNRALVEPRVARSGDDRGVSEHLLESRQRPARLQPAARERVAELVDWILARPKADRRRSADWSHTLRKAMATVASVPPLVVEHSVAWSRQPASVEGLSRYGVASAELNCIDRGGIRDAMAARHPVEDIPSGIERAVEERTYD